MDYAERFALPASLRKSLKSCLQIANLSSLLWAHEMDPVMATRTYSHEGRNIEGVSPAALDVMDCDSVSLATISDLAGWVCFQITCAEQPITTIDCSLLFSERARGFVVAGFDNRRLTVITIGSKIELVLQHTVPRESFPFFA